MSRLTPAEKTAYRDRIARAKTLPATMAVINEAAAAARPPIPAAPASPRKPVAIRPAAPTSTITTPAPAAAKVEQDGSDIVALARSAGLAGMSPRPASEKSSHHSNPTNDASDIVALVHAAGLAGFKRQNEEQSK